MEYWDLIIHRPILNFLILLTDVMFGNFGLAIIVLTILVRGVMAPLTLKQLRSTKVMQEKMSGIQPKLQLLKKKYAKDPQKLRQEQMGLYKEAGVSPMGCLSSPMLVSTIIQIPIFIALYRSIIQALAVTPQDFLGLSESLYSWPMVHQALPVSGKFLWLDLGSPDPYFILPLLVMGTMWLSQKMMARPTSADPSQQSMQNMMQIMMPLMFGFITFTLPGGLGLYFVAVTALSIVIQSFVYGLRNPFAKAPAAEPAVGVAGKPGKLRADIPAITTAQVPKPEEGEKRGKSGSKRKGTGGKRKDGGGSHRARPGATGT